MRSRVVQMFVLTIAAAGLVACGEVLSLTDGAALDPHLVCDEGGCRCEDGFARCGEGATACATDVRTSAEHCGACGYDCEGGSCVDGLCTPTRLAAVENVGIAWFGAGDRIGAARVFNLTGGTLALVSLEGGITEELDAPSSYWETIYSIVDGEGETYLLAPLSGDMLPGPELYGFEGGSAKAKLVCASTGALVLTGVTTKFVYFSMAGSTQRCRAPRGVYSMMSQCIDGLSSTSPLRATAAGSKSYWRSLDGGINVWADDGATTQLLATEPGATLGALSVSGEELYMVETFSPCPDLDTMTCDRVSAVPASGGPRRVLSVIPAQGPPALSPSLAVDDTGVYLFDGRSEGALLRVPIEGGEAQRIGVGMFARGRVLMDEGALYFTDHTAVYRVVKPRRGTLR